MTRADLIVKVRQLKRLSLVALLGAGLMLFSFFSDYKMREWPSAVVFVGVMLIVPCVFYLVAPSIWHWKARYQGARSNLWGVILAVEASGWFKIVYLFRHVLPDARGTGRYAASDSNGV